MSALRIEDLYCQHQQQAVLSGISLTVEDNEILFVRSVPRCGGGKTTLLRAIRLDAGLAGDRLAAGSPSGGAGMSVPAEQRRQDLFSRTMRCFLI